MLNCLKNTTEMREVKIYPINIYKRNKNGYVRWCAILNKRHEERWYIDNSSPALIKLRGQEESKKVVKCSINIIICVLARWCKCYILSIVINLWFIISFDYCEMHTNGS